MSQMKDKLLIPVVNSGDLAALCLVPSAGSSFLNYVGLSRALRPVRPIVIVNTMELNGSGSQTLVDFALSVAEALSQTLPSGQIFLGGHCWGGLLAVQIAARLEALNQPVAGVALLDAIPPRRPGSQTGNVDSGGMDSDVQKTDRSEALEGLYDQIRQ